MMKKTNLEIIGVIPYYIPIPEGLIIAPTALGAEPFQIFFHHFEQPRPLGSSYGHNVDDRLGTFLKSEAHISFPLQIVPSEEDQEKYVRRAVDLVNKILLSIKFVSVDHSFRPILHFESYTTKLWQFTPDGKQVPIVEWKRGEYFGPFGLQLRTTLTSDALQRLAWVFNDLFPINPTTLLVIDAKYHNVVGDISRAILDLGTALEINIPNLVNLYSAEFPQLANVEFENRTIWNMYNDLLQEITGHSLRDRRDLYVELEYIRGLRNSITHEWKPVFRITKESERYSPNLSELRRRDGHVITTSVEVEKLIQVVTQIINYTEELFESKRWKP